VSREVPHARLRQEFAALEEAAARDFAHEEWQDAPRFIRTIDLRYRGQGYELNLPLTKNLVGEFEKEHQRRYGYRHPNREIEIVTLRVRGVVSSRSGDAQARPESKTRGASNEAKVMFGGRKVITKTYDREGLSVRKTYRGPAVVTEYSATTVVPPGKRFRIDETSNLIIQV